MDDIFNLKTGIGLQLFKKIRDARMKIQMFFNNGLRGDILTPDYIDQMIEAGTIGFALALETAAPRLQKMIKKNLDIDKFHRNIDYITSKHSNVMLDIFFMIGFPTETEEEMAMTLDFVKAIRWVHFPLFALVNISFGEMEAIVKRRPFDLIGFRAINCYADFLHQCVAIIRQWDYDGPIVVGGPYPTSDYNIALRDPNITLAVIGEGEQSLFELAKAMISNKNKLPSIETLKTVPSLCLRENPYV